MQLRLKDGDTFHNRYRILSLLGSGGSGDVFLALQIDANRRVALKILNTARDKKENLDRFLREFKLLSGLSHDGIVTFYSAAISEEGYPYAVFEFIKGRSLHTVLNESARISWSRLAPIAIQICDAMEYAHNNSVIHRDLKPANIMLMDAPEPDTVKVIDFGLGKVMQETGQKLTGTGMLMGTPHYMSPEQALGLTVDARSDIYALACIIYECLCGRKIFDAHSPIGILHKQANEDPTEILDASFPSNAAPLVKILTKALAKDPAQRYQTMLQLRNDLDKISNAGFQANTGNNDEYFQPHSKKSFPILNLVSVGLVCLATLIGLNLLRTEALRKRNIANSTVPASNSVSADQPTKHEAMLEEQMDRYEERLKNENNPDRRKSLIDEYFRRGKDLRFRQKRGNGTVIHDSEMRTVRRMLKYCSEMDDSSLLESDLYRTLAYYELQKKDFKGALQYCDKGLKLLAGKQDESRVYSLRLYGAKAQVFLRMHKFKEAREIVEKFDQFLGIPKKEPSMPISSQFPVSLTQIKSSLGHESMTLADVIEELKPQSSAEMKQQIEILNDLALVLLKDNEPATALSALDRADDLLNKLRLEGGNYKSFEELTKKLRTQVSQLKKLN